jgi:hypothetical protein
MKLITAFLFCALAALATPVFAQWQWTDHDGRRVFSDRPPPADIPEKNILKRPAARAAAERPPQNENTGEADAAAANAPLAVASQPKVPVVDKELAAKKKQLEEAELAKKRVEEERILKARVENCARAKQAKATLDLGTRLVRANKAGEREIMDDTARAAEGKRIQSIIDSDCR